jgi:hypothetical protein
MAVAGGLARRRDRDMTVYVVAQLAFTRVRRASWACSGSRGRAG